MPARGAREQPTGKEGKPKIIIKRAKGRRVGHHGGAWKVAYADFVTAMMALFIVLWVLGSSDPKVKAGIAHYFRDPGVFSGSSGVVPDGGQDKLGSGIAESPSLEALESHIKQEFAKIKDFPEIQDQVMIKVTDEGLLIEIIDKDKQGFFEVSSATVKPVMRKVLALVVKEIKDAPNQVAIGGHTDARPFHNDSFYSNWDLSAARALNTRRSLEEMGIPSGRVERVVGYADRQLRVPDSPLSSENRRISILVMKLVQEKNKENKSSS
jgi:chemotaxis protein MotB